MPRFPTKNEKLTDGTQMQLGTDLETDKIVHFSEDTPREDARARRIRIKNRRKRWLDLHPEYFESSHHELRDPLVYDRLIRRFLTTAERETQGRARGTAATLEASLLRSEAKLAAARQPEDLDGPLTYSRAADGSIVGVEQDEMERVESKKEGRETWTEVLTRRFVERGDDEVGMDAVDGDEDLDMGDTAEGEAFEQWVENEGEEFLGHGRPEGETGIQDF